MSWRINVLDVLPAPLREDFDGGGYATWRPLFIGDAWYMHRTPEGTWKLAPDDEWTYDVHLSPFYLRHNAHRPPLVVCLPSPHGRRGVYPWCVDEQERSGSRGFYGDGWTVTGDLPNLTVAPSINIGGTYHGWIRDGVITPDCEGRTYPNAFARS
jgi:hypothetical protein